MKFIWISQDPVKGISKELLELSRIRKACDADIINMTNGAVAFDMKIAESGYVRKILPEIKKSTAVYFVAGNGFRERMLVRGQDRNYGVHPYIREITGYIDAHFTEDISLKDLSELTFLSESYVSSLFKEKTGMSVKEYIEEKRLDYSRELLLKTDLKVREIGARAGFRSASYFCRRFRERFGDPPQQYRALRAGVMI